MSDYYKNLANDLRGLNTLLEDLAAKIRAEVGADVRVEAAVDCGWVLLTGSSRGVRAAFDAMLRHGKAARDASGRAIKVKKVGGGYFWTVDTGDARCGLSVAQTESERAAVLSGAANWIR